MEGLNWYKEAHSFALSLSKKHNKPLDMVVGVIAILSPQKKWELNKLQANLFLEGKELVGMVSSKQLESAQRIVNGENFLSVINKGSMKIKNFYHNILTPNCPNFITIDTHMVKIYRKQFPYTKVKSPKQVFQSKKFYNLLANWVKREAALNGVLPCEYQAHLWVMKKKNNIT